MVFLEDPPCDLFQVFRGDESFSQWSSPLQALESLCELEQLLTSEIPGSYRSEQQRHFRQKFGVRYQIRRNSSCTECRQIHEFATARIPFFKLQDGRHSLQRVGVLRWRK